MVGLICWTKKPRSTEAAAKTITAVYVRVVQTFVIKTLEQQSNRVCVIVFNRDITLTVIHITDEV